jgi:hypothetical protein|tara:strand:+ start:5965 stop:6192 length:228 start_codon:yes stop_codon:yes gene_type:complete
MQLLKIQRRNKNTRTGFSTSQNLTPWADNQAMPKGFAATIMPAGLTGSNDETGIFNGPRAGQDLKMSRARHRRKR